MTRGGHLSFSAKKSSDDKAIIKYSFYVNSELIRENQNPEFSYKFIEAGIFYVEVIIEDADGYISSARRKVTVNENLVRHEQVYFDYFLEQNQLSLIFHQLIPLEEIKGVTYTITNQDSEQVDSFELNNFHHRSTLEIDSFDFGEYKIKLSVIDIYEREFTFERIIQYKDDESFYKKAPIVEFTHRQVGPKEVLVDFRNIFDPSDRLEWIEVEWGDDESDEVDTDVTRFLKHEYRSTGTYEIKVIVAKEIDDEEVVHEIIVAIDVTNDEISALPPLVDYNVFIEDFAPYVTFNVSRSISPTSEITSIVFDHGDGTFYSGMEKAHTHFYEPGIYISKLTVTDSLGLQAVQTAQIIVAETGGSLIASLDCEHDGAEALCEYRVIDKAFSLTKVTLDWGDGTIVNLPIDQSDLTWDETDHEYSALGKYNVTLKVENSLGSVEESTMEIDLNDNSSGIDLSPVARVICKPTGISKEVECDFSNSYDPNGYITEFVLSFGDGNSVVSTNSSPVRHRYESNGLYEVSLLVTDNDDLSNSIKTNIELINQPPIAELHCFSSGPLLLDCESSSYDNDGYIVSYQFDWDEGSQSGIEASFSTTLSSGGYKEVRLSILDNEGSLQEESLSVFVVENIAPIASFTCRSDSPGQLACSSQSYDSDGSIVKLKWDIGDHAIFTENVSLTMNPGEAVEVSLQVEDNLGGVTTLVKSVQLMDVVVNHAPLISFSCGFQSVLNISCSSNSSDPEGKVITHKYYINDRLISQESNLNYTFKNSERGEVLVRLVVSDGEMETVKNESYYINILPSAEIVCEQPDAFKIICSALNAIDDGSITDYSWIEGESNFYNGESIEIPLTSYGAINLSLTMTDDLGEMSTTVKEVRTYNYDLAPVAGFSYYADLDFKVLLNASEVLTGGRKIETYTWFVNDIQVSESDEPVLIYEFSGLGQYKVKLLIVDHLGISDEIEKDISVYNMEVSQPSYEDNSQDLIGIDSDSNGIRDDLQRSVNAYAKSDNNIKNALNDFVKVNVALISNLDNLALTNTNYSKRKEIQRCIASVVPTTHYSEVINEFKVLIFNSRQRIEKWAIMKETITDETLSKDVDETKEACAY